MSFFFPSGVNGYIKDYLNSRSIQIQAGISDIILNLSCKLDISYKLNENINLSGLVDVAFAPKFIMIPNTGSTETFSFNRYSPGATCDLYVGGRKKINSYLEVAYYIILWNSVVIQAQG